jgi:CheY-like chemotaxis protein
MKPITRVILIDDNEADNVYHEIILRKAGYGGELQVFEWGADALDYLRSCDMDPPTLVFLDVNMPVMDGFEFARQATSLLLGAESVRLLMLTSSDSPVDRKRARAMSVIRDYLTKPLSVEQARTLLQLQA